MLQDFFRDLDATVGKDNYLAVLTADHGFMPAPEVSLARGRDAGRINRSETLARLNAGLEKRFATPKLALYASASALVLDKKLIAQKGLSFDTVADAARELLLAEPGFAAAYTRAELTSGSRAGAPFFDAVRKSLERRSVGRHPGRAQAVLDVRVELGGTTHGSPHPYDTHVPILFYGPAWTHAGRIDQHVEVVDIAPTLSALLGVATPAASEGKLLPLGAR